HGGEPAGAGPGPASAAAGTGGFLRPVLAGCDPGLRRRAAGGGHPPGAAIHACQRADACTAVCRFSPCRRPGRALFGTRHRRVQRWWYIALTVGMVVFGCGQYVDAIWRLATAYA